jgi:hypothetical protein
MFLVGLFALVHAIISLIPQGVYGYLVVLIGLTVVLWRRVFAEDNLIDSHS